MPYHNSDKRFEKYQNIAFMPLDIPYEKMDLEELQVFSDRNYICLLYTSDAADE